MGFLKTCVQLAALLSFFTSVSAGFSSGASNNVAVYWGQNSFGASSGDAAQQRLSYYCSNTEFDIIPLAFLLKITDPEINFASASNDCTLFPGTNLLNCPEIAADIATCQSTYGKTILLSIGGATYSEGGFSSSSAAISAANNIWAIFGPQVSGSGALRPFGSSAVDGFDFDFESTVTNMVPFAAQLRSLMDADKAQTGKNWVLTAAPQCPFPDAADNEILSNVYMDAVFVQFYNNYCGLQSFTAGSSTQNNFNFETWDNWAKGSKNPNVKVFLGMPGSTTAAGSGYTTGSALDSIISYCKTFSSFGGAMIWDMSQIYNNAGFLDNVSSALGGSSGGSSPSPPSSPGNPPSVPTAPAAAPTTTTTTSSVAQPTATATSSGGQDQWQQCGGEGYTGPTVCKAPYTCVVNSVWWAQCQ